MNSSIAQDTGLTRVQLARLARAKAIKSLKAEYLKPDEVVYAILRHVSKSGTTRFIDLYIIDGGLPYRITKLAADAIAIRYDRRRDAIRVMAVGLDAAEHVVSDLAWHLFGNCDALKRRWL
ncbi:hypothetical protein M2103_000563 [Ereboglobus sp. PH5-5]|uniref:hypothetical protein n=1 Tax=Ereboglobus sp. PH5-5 TaxID=2940529 RepID=UPI00240536AB|nr:hypothetical protein [Ereboglobus sp. PH5-5]MDF9832353.1 hypothetical protein [Ereboglobus sp. PH5-5]